MNSSPSDLSPAMRTHPDPPLSGREPVTSPHEGERKRGSVSGPVLRGLPEGLNGLNGWMQWVEGLWLLNHGSWRWGGSWFVTLQYGQGCTDVPVWATPVRTEIGQRTCPEGFARRIERMNAKDVSSRLSYGSACPDGHPSGWTPCLTYRTRK